MVIRRFINSFILLYQRLIRPLLPVCCRFYPSCSEYSRQAVMKYGVFKGAAKSVWRILRCNPFSDGGEDHLT
ncbi:MAG: membrane protein insertion efficiency factor YidD [Candidatus Omnitrophica bacterium]|nr:membrane protein insertion efficiency factor YidD [Candidatus Omnitrophota bacterium]